MHCFFSFGARAMLTRIDRDVSKRRHPSSSSSSSYRRRRHFCRWSRVVTTLPDRWRPSIVHSYVSADTYLAWQSIGARPSVGVINDVFRGNVSAAATDDVMAMQIQMLMLMYMSTITDTLILPYREGRGGGRVLLDFLAEVEWKYKYPPIFC